MQDHMQDNEKRKEMPRRAALQRCGWLVLILICILCGCSAGTKQKRAGENESSGTGVYFDTVVDVRIFGENADELLQGCFDLCEEAEKTLSAHRDDSELYRLNHRLEQAENEQAENEQDENEQAVSKQVEGIQEEGSRTEPQSFEVSEELASCIGRGLEYAELSGGKFDITILPLRELWDFESEDASVPAPEEIEQALAKVDYRKVHVDGTTVTFDDPETQIDLGGIAKGYISAKLKNWLKEQGCTSALINLGGNVSVLGTKPDGSSWNVGIQEPFADRGTVFETVEIDSGCVISSGTYERYFEQDGTLYHHILDPETGCPVITDLQQASVVGEDDVLCDAFSTICILEGREEAERIAGENGLDVKIFFVGDNHRGIWFP